jgi:hypothetical protein
VPTTTYLPDEQAYVELAGVVGGGGRDGGAHGDAAVGLDEAGAEEVVASGGLVSVRLQQGVKSVAGSRRRMPCQSVCTVRTYRPVGEEPRRVVPVQLRADLPAGLDGVEVVAEGSGDDPDLRQAELRRRAHLRRPHVDARLRAVVLVAGHVPHRVLHAHRT